MKTDRVEYRVSGRPAVGWRIFRQDAQLGSRHDLFDAVVLATYLAEREAILGATSAKVVLDGPLSDLGVESPHGRCMQ